MLKKQELIIKTEEASDKIPPVDEVELEAYDRSTHYKAIVNKNTLSTIAVVPVDHHYIQHKHVIDIVNKLENYVIKQINLLGDNGEKMIISLSERTPRKIELMPDDFIECGALIINDYTKNCGLSVQGIATRLVCSNGMVSTQRSQKMHIYAFGTQDFHDELLSKIETSFEHWMYTVDFFKEAASAKVPVKDVIPHHTFLPEKYIAEITQSLSNEASLYEIYNAYTQVITHSLSLKASTETVNRHLKRANRILETEITTE